MFLQFEYRNLLKKCKRNLLRTAVNGSFFAKFYSNPLVALSTHYMQIVYSPEISVNADKAYQEHVIKFLSI